MKAHERILTRTNEGRPLTMRCECGRVLSFGRPGSDVDCDHCGRTYNFAGQQLADRSQWGEETGETAADYDRGFNNPSRAFDEE